MSIRTVTHLNFQGNARAALAFYHDVFKGEQMQFTYAQVGRGNAAMDPEHIVWGQVTGEDGIALMAYDVPAGVDWHPGEQAFFVSLRGDDADTVRNLWEGLSDGAVLLHGLAPSPWSALYGMLCDRFGVTWAVDVTPPSASA